MLTVVSAVQTGEDSECSGYAITDVSAVQTGEDGNVQELCYCCVCSSNRRGW